MRRWKPVVFPGILALNGVLVMAACSLHLPVKPVNPVDSEFSLAKDTSWIYSYSEYQPAPADPTQVITAQFQLTETVTETSSINGLFIAHVQREKTPVQVPADWLPTQPPGEFWYVVKSGQVFQSFTAVDPATLDTDVLLLAFELPLSPNKSWCPVRIDMKDPSHKPITTCDFAGKLTVLKQSAYQVPAGKFEDCYQIGETSNGEDVFQRFCKNVGVVEVKFDHSGSRFGFIQQLSGYNKGGR